MTDRPRGPLADVFVLTLGTCLLFFDFGLYSLFAVQISKTFFPPAEMMKGLLWTFAVFSLSFLTRPVGAWLFGRRADTHQRSSALTWSFIFMGGGALAIALTPGYETIGLLAPLLLVLSRMAQGLAAGGEPGPAIALMVEIAPPGREGLYASAVFAGQTAALALGGLLAIAMHTLLTPEALAEWGWRACFLLSAAIAPFGAILRSRLREPQRPAADSPSIEPRRIGEIALLGMLLGIGATLSQYLVSYMTTFMQVSGVSMRASLATPIVLGLVGILFCTGGGILADRWGLRPASLAPRIAFLVLVLALIATPLQHSSGMALATGLLLAAAHFLALGVTGLMIARKVAQAQRATTIGVVYAVAVTLFGGTAHLVFTWLIEATQWQLSPLVYVAAANVLSLYAAHPHHLAPVIAAPFEFRGRATISWAWLRRFSRSTPAGLYCPAGDFHIDPMRPVARALITHGHSDHARAGHGSVLATEETLGIMAIRCGENFCAARQAAAYGAQQRIGSVDVSFHPAGHVLGSAQIALEGEHEGRRMRIVVSGDYKRQRDPTCLPFEPLKCDIFITEATFGLPVFRHPDTRHEVERLLHSQRLFPERTHLVGAYSLGKAQRMAAILREAGYDRPIYLHGAMEKLMAFYESRGIGFGETRKATAAERSLFAGEIVLCPPSAIADLWSRRFPEPLAAFASGWMRIRARARQRGVELPLVVSDHADWDDLTATILETGCSEVWVTHGEADALVHWAQTPAAARPAPAHARLRRGRGNDSGRGRMNRFAELLDAIAFDPSRNGKLRLIADYFRTTPDPDRGFALAAMTGALDFVHAKPAMIRTLISDRTDPVLFALSYDYVGDLSETVALLWPAAETATGSAPHLSAVVATLTHTGKTQLPKVLAGLLDALDEKGRWALLKLITGGLRIGVSARLAKTALASTGAHEDDAIHVDAIEEIWPGLAPPYTELFAWIEGRGERPRIVDAAPFRPVMLSHAIEERDFRSLTPQDFCAEWKWDGIRVQAVAGTGEDGVRRTRLYSRTGEDISGAFPEIAESLHDPRFGNCTIDGELLILREGKVESFATLQQRLNRKSVTAKLIAEYPAHIRAYDLLAADGEDLRSLPFTQRRERLEELLEQCGDAQFDLSPLVPFADWEELAAARAQPEDFGAQANAQAIEGVMIKRAESPYVPGRPKGLWFKWKRDPFTVDAVLMYAQRGHGKRSSFYSDYTFGVWRAGDSGDELVPVGKAYFGFTDEELKQIDKFVRDNTTNRFGPVREVATGRDRGLVLEIAFEGLQHSPRHKSGIAMRFPRIARIRWDKPAGEADRIEALTSLIGKRK